MTKKTKKCKKTKKDCIDPCEVIPFDDLAMQMYTITDNANVFTFPDISNEDCAFMYTYAVETIDADAAITFDGATQEFTVQYIQDLVLSGTTFIDYTITVTATVPCSEPLLMSFVLRIKEPCTNTNFVSIVED